MISAIEQAFRTVATVAALGIEVAAVGVLAFAALEALLGALSRLRAGSTRAVWVRFAGWILLALEFTLAADIIRTVIAPTWTEIGKLAAIAAIRTALNYFLGLDIRETERHAEAVVPTLARDPPCRD